MELPEDSKPRAWCGGHREWQGVPEIQPDYEHLAEAAPHGLHILLEDRLAYVNPAFCEICGYTREALLAMSCEQFIELVHHEDREHCRSRWHGRWHGEMPPPSVVYRLIRADGEMRWIEVHSRHIEYGGRQAVHVTSQDITARVRAEEELMERSRSDALVRSVAVGLVDHDADRGLRTGLEILGEYLGASGCFLFDCRKDEPEICCTHSWLRPGLGRPVAWPSVSLDIIEGVCLERLRSNQAIWPGAAHPEESCRLSQALTTQGWPEWMLAPVLEEGSLHSVIAVLRHEEGRVWGAAERRTLERATEILALGAARRESDLARRNLRSHLTNAQRLESLGLFAAQAVGQIDQSLEALEGIAELAHAGASPGGPHAVCLAQVLQHAEAARQKTRHLLRMTDSAPRQTRPVNLNQLVRRLVPVLTEQTGGPVTLRLDLSPAAPMVEADPGQMRQCLSQLAANAAEAVENGDAIIEIHTRVRTVESSELRSPYVSGFWPVGRYVFVEVGDNGKGMDAAECARFADPSYTTKGVGRGLGMAVVLGIVEQHGGGLRVESAPNQGARVILWFPAS